MSRVGSGVGVKALILDWTCPVWSDAQYDGYIHDVFALAQRCHITRSLPVLCHLGLHSCLIMQLLA